MRSCLSDAIVNQKVVSIALAKLLLYGQHLNFNLVLHNLDFSPPYAQAYLRQWFLDIYKCAIQCQESTTFMI